MNVTKNLTPAQRIIVAFDVDSLVEAEILAKQLSGTGVMIKVGNQLGTYEGWAKIRKFANKYNFKLFCDTKFKDIPNTVEKSARAITRHQPEIFNIMADNSKSALEGAVKGVKSAIKDYKLKVKPLVIGVTVLTSKTTREVYDIYAEDSETKVMQFAKYAAQSGLDGVVCSAHEAELLRKYSQTKKLILITPGIRPKWAAEGDQARIMTPKKALQKGADYLVIGRPITQPPPEIGSPLNALNKIIEEIS